MRLLAVFLLEAEPMEFEGSEELPLLLLEVFLRLELDSDLVLCDSDSSASSSTNGLRAGSNMHNSLFWML